MRDSRAAEERERWVRRPALNGDDQPGPTEFTLLSQQAADLEVDVLRPVSRRGLGLD
jgi:hypothetical protein